MIKIISFIIVALIVSIILKNIKSNLSPLVSIFVVISVCIFSVITISPTIDFINSLALKIDLKESYLITVLKCIAICFLSSICTNICKDSGENALAYSAEIACRFTVISLTLPIYMDIFNWILKIWENI